MEITLSEDFNLEGEEKELLNAIVRDTGENFEELLDLADIQKIDIGGPTEYQEFYSRPMSAPGSSPAIWQHNPFSEGELQIFVQDPTHVPHEMAHQVENLMNQIQSSVADEPTNIVDNNKGTDKAYSESFAYLNQLKYFTKLPEFYDVEFEDLERLEAEETSWQEYNTNPRNHPDLYHAAGFQAALAMHEYDIDPVELLSEPEKYSQIVEDALAAAWISGRNNGEINRDKYNQVVEKSVEKLLREE